MSSVKMLKDYLINDGNGFLLNADNNGKTIMLSGSWGVGKTHFWNNEILQGQKGLLEQLKDKACIYISLYGTDSLESLKKEVLIKASIDREKENSLLSKEVSTFGFDALSSISNSDLDIGKVLNTFKDLDHSIKSKKGSKKLQDGGIVCFDDFERKSNDIDLNDLFGFISQLALEYNCKVVIILNSDVFEGQEANVFKAVKEKTVNKFFHFEPTIEELFNSVSKNKKYNRIESYKEEILHVIEETKELNARIYMQILDNCLEWINAEYDKTVIRSLILCTIFFVKNHYTFAYVTDKKGEKVYELIENFIENYEIAHYIRNIFPQHAPQVNSNEIIHLISSNINKKTKDNNGIEKSDEYYVLANKILKDNGKLFSDFYHYEYILDINLKFDNEVAQEINQFVKTGILPKK